VLILAHTLPADTVGCLGVSHDTHIILCNETFSFMI